MYINYNPNPKQKRVGDCVIRAICKATDQDWDDVYTQICLEGLMMCDMPSINPVWGSYLRKRGFEQVMIPNTCPNCYTIADFCNDHPDGVYVVGTGTHVVCVKSGDVYDAWNSLMETPVYYFRR